MPGRETHKPTHMCPIFFFTPFTIEEVSLLPANITSLSTCSGSHQLILRPCLLSLFLSIGLFPSAYNLWESLPFTPHTLPAGPLFQILSRANIFRESPPTLSSPFSLLQYHFCPRHTSVLTNASMLANPGASTFLSSLSYSVGSGCSVPPY